jgi:hypothetical protein
MVKLIVPVPPAETKIPLPLFDPESTTPLTPTVLLLKIPVREGVPTPAEALKNVIALPSASRKLLPSTLNVTFPCGERQVATADDVLRVIVGELVVLEDDVHRV